MKKAALLASLLLTGNGVLAEGAVVDGLAASEIVREGEIIAIELDERDWHLLVDYDDMLYACWTDYNVASAALQLICERLSKEKL